MLLSEALRRYDALKVVPIFSATVITFGTSSAVAFFDETKKLNGDHIGVWIAGSVLVVLGVLILAVKPDPEDEDPGGLFSPESKSLLTGDSPASPLAEETAAHWTDILESWQDHCTGGPRRACGKEEGEKLFSMECLTQQEPRRALAVEAVEPGQHTAL